MFSDSDIVFSDSDIVMYLVVLDSVTRVIQQVRVLMLMIVNTLFYTSHGTFKIIQLSRGKDSSGIKHKCYILETEIGGLFR